MYLTVNMETNKIQAAEKVTVQSTLDKYTTPKRDISNLSPDINYEELEKTNRGKSIKLI